MIYVSGGSGDSSVVGLVGGAGCVQLGGVGDGPAYVPAVPGPAHRTRHARSLRVWSA